MMCKQWCAYNDQQHVTNSVQTMIVIMPNNNIPNDDHNGKWWCANNDDHDFEQWCPNSDFSNGKQWCANTNYYDDQELCATKSDSTNGSSSLGGCVGHMMP